MKVVLKWSRVVIVTKKSSSRVLIVLMEVVLEWESGSEVVVTKINSSSKF